MATYKVTYFPGKGGGEIIRLALAQAGQDFEDERITKEDWPKLKPSTPMKQMPLCTVTENGKSTVYCQSGAIAKYIARKYGFFGSTPEEELLVDEVYESLSDTMRELMKGMFADTEEAKKEGFQKFTDEALPKFISYVKSRQDKYGQNGFIIGSKVSLADIAIYNFVDQTATRGMGNIWEKYPDIKTLETLVASQKNIAAWVAKRPASDF